MDAPRDNTLSISLTRPALMVSSALMLDAHFEWLPEGDIPRSWVAGMGEGPGQRFVLA